MLSDGIELFQTWESRVVEQLLLCNVMVERILGCFCCVVDVVNCCVLMCTDMY